MMKCKYCGGNLTLEQAYCPHCGRPNEEAAQHVKDMEHYKSNFEDTKAMSMKWRRKIRRSCHI